MYIFFEYVFALYLMAINKTVSSKPEFLKRGTRVGLRKDDT